jgi:hypothetical protein
MAALKGLEIETVLGKEKFHDTGYGRSTRTRRRSNKENTSIWPAEVATGKRVLRGLLEIDL